MESLAAFPRVPTLAERGLHNGVANLYVRMADRGELLQTGGEASDIGELVTVALHRFGPPVAIAADRWRADELRDILTAHGVPRCPFHERGQGFMDGGADVRDFRRACVEGRVRPVPSLLLASAMAEARTVSDAAGNAKLAKSVQGRRRRVKDDAAAAAILAVATGTRQPFTMQPSWICRGMVG